MNELNNEEKFKKLYKMICEIGNNLKYRINYIKINPKIIRRKMIEIALFKFYYKTNDYFSMEIIPITTMNQHTTNRSLFSINYDFDWKNLIIDLFFIHIYVRNNY